MDNNNRKIKITILIIVIIVITIITAKILTKKSVTSDENNKISTTESAKKVKSISGENEEKILNNKSKIESISNGESISALNSESTNAINNAIKSANGYISGYGNIYGNIYQSEQVNIILNKNANKDANKDESESKSETENKSLKNTVFKYEAIQYFSEELNAVKKNGKWGLVDKYGNEKLQIKYNEIGYLQYPDASDQSLTKVALISEDTNVKTKNANLKQQYSYAKQGYITVDRNGNEVNGLIPTIKWGFINSNGDLINEPEYDEIKIFSEGWAPIKNGDKWGFVHASKKWIFYTQWIDVRNFLGGFAPVKMSNGKWKLIDKDGNYVLEKIVEGQNSNVQIEYDEIMNFSNQYAPVKSNGKWGYINNQGILVQKCEFDEVGMFINGIAKVKKDNKWGLLKLGDVNVKNTLSTMLQNDLNKITQILECKYDEISFFDNDGIAQIKNDGKWGLVKYNGEVILTCKYSEIRNFNNGVSLVSFGTADTSSVTWGYIDKNGNLLQGEDLIKNISNVKWGYMDSTGKAVTDFELISKKIQEDSNKESTLKWGVIKQIKDNNGNVLSINEIIEPKYTEILDFNDDGIAPVKIDSKWGLINIEGKIILTPKYNEMKTFVNGFAQVKNTESKWGFIDKKGNIIKTPEYDIIRDFKDDYAAVCKNIDSKEFGGKLQWGFINKYGQEVIQFKYDMVMDFSEGFAGIMVKDKDFNTKWGFVDKSGNAIIQPQFSIVQNFSQDRANVGIYDVGTTNIIWAIIDKTGKVIN